jgi:hypothetical protein
MHSVDADPLAKKKCGHKHKTHGKRVCPRFMEIRSTDEAIEHQLIGRWLGCTGRETFEYNFEAKNRFTVIITPVGKPSHDGWGYWDVQKGSLRIGTAPNDCQSTPILLESDFFQMDRIRFNRQPQGV